MILSIYFQYRYDGKLAKDTEKFVVIPEIYVLFNIELC